MDRGDTAPGNTGQRWMAAAQGASRPCIHATSACGVDDALQGSFPHFEKKPEFSLVSP